MMTHVSQAEVLAANSQRIMCLNALIPEVSFALAGADDVRECSQYTNISRANFQLFHFGVEFKRGRVGGIQLL